MDIQSLKLLITEDDINQLIERYLPEGGPIEEPRVRLFADGVLVQGKYPTPLGRMSFETLWKVSASGNTVRAHLETIRVAGLPAKLLRGVLLKTIHDVAGSQPGVRVENEAVEVNVEEAAQGKGVTLRVGLITVSGSPGTLVVEARDSASEGPEPPVCSPDAEGPTGG
jgi:hypothetical protein